MSARPGDRDGFLASVHKDAFEGKLSFLDALKVAFDAGRHGFVVDDRQAEPSTVERALLRAAQAMNVAYHKPFATSEGVARAFATEMLPLLHIIGVVVPPIASETRAEPPVDTGAYPRKESTPPATGGIHVQKVEIVINGATDPDRVARAVRAELAKLGGGGA